MLVVVGYHCKQSKANETLSGKEIHEIETLSGTKKSVKLLSFVFLLLLNE